MDNVGLLGHEDSVQELSLVLAADLANLGNLRAGLRQTSEVVALEDKLVLSGLGELDSAAVSQVDKVALLSSQEVFDLDLSLVLGDVGVDGEMCMNQSHLVKETLKQF